ncbi:TIGR03617 family F420-dependent LLM class oxidoreductase [Nocardia sp. CDC159]|uniref:TIGR03617 family F420-dependent LLM class oxidoreductase n=1 Tax=Nocardia pulmonis TaxID=2951408 RepID=A0A9X2E2L6_9NOCA|nr:MULTISPECIES: TIGR03617 family F420-dependent LLM class oxidoreductase [Nocardia]MCM6772505.1 TIGR03617 family F420-dependent LLM class oxidoreductase [Nocardia pulmonis]MCM6784837.1 TIGR03617 family F420-dependent LLM class oxidoreductase [Nocardia sp. CDC159]
MRIDIQLDARPDRVIERARELTASGVDGLFTFEGAHDVFVSLAAVAPTVPVQLTTNVAVAFPRSPLHVAHMAYDLHLLSGGRFRLGLGSQIRPHIENRYGASWSRPAARLGEFVTAVKTILTAWQERTPLNFRGEFTRHTLMPPTFDPGPNPHGIAPVLMGGLGPRMVRTAARVADGLLVMPFNSERHFRERTLPAVAEGLARAGRAAADLEIVPQVMAAMWRTEGERQRAEAGVRRLIAFYGSTPAYAPVLEVEGRAELRPRLNDLSKRGAVAAMSELVDDALLAAIAVRGTPEQCAAQIVARFGAVAQRVCVYFPGYAPPAPQLTDLVAALRHSPRARR